LLRDGAFWSRTDQERFMSIQHAAESALVITGDDGADAAVLAYVGPDLPIRAVERRGDGLVLLAETGDEIALPAEDDLLDLVEEAGRIFVARYDVDNDRYGRESEVDKLGFAAGGPRP
jgi:hypothetical protein